MTSYTFLIGKSRDDSTGTHTVPGGTEVPRPSDIRHIWRQSTGRDIGGIVTLSVLEGMDWIYNVTGDRVVTDLFSHYDPNNPYVWVQIFDPYSDSAHWYEAVMYEPHIERSAGSTISVLIVSFRSMVRQ